eukprot:s429_g1.t1
MAGAGGMRKQVLKRPKKSPRQPSQPESSGEALPGASVIAGDAQSPAGSQGSMVEAAIKDVMEAIESEGGVLKQCLPDWHLRHKPHLGRFRKFLHAHPQMFTVTDTPGDCFLVSRSGEPAPPPVDPRSWQRRLKRAWRRYCQEMPESNQSLNDFLGPLKVETDQLLCSSSSVQMPGAEKEPDLLPPPARRPRRRVLLRPKGALKKRRKATKISTGSGGRAYDWLSLEPRDLRSGRRSLQAAGGCQSSTGRPCSMMMSINMAFDEQAVQAQARACDNFGKARA